MQYQKTIAHLRTVAGKVRTRGDASDRLDADLLFASANRFKNMLHDQRRLLNKLRALDPDCALVAEFDRRDGRQTRELTMHERMALMMESRDE